MDPIDLDDRYARRSALRVAVVTETYPPEVNGVAVTIARLVEGLRDRGHEIQVTRPRQRCDASPEGGAARNTVLVPGLPIPRYPQLRLGLPATRTLVRRWDAPRPDLVHVVTEGPLGWSAARAAARLRIPVVSDFRTNFHAYSRHYGVGSFQGLILHYLRSFHNGTRVTMVPTEATRAALTRDGFRNIEVIARGVDAALFHPRRRSDALRRTWNADENSTVVLHVGRLAPEKNLQALIGAFAAANGVNRKLRLVLVGDGPARREMQRRVPAAIFAGVRRGTDLAEHYASADAFLFPSVTETFGNVTAEAMASGLPVLAYDYAAAGQLIEPGVNGQLAIFDNTSDFVRLAREMLADPTKLRTMGLEARRTAETLGWDRIVGQLEGVYLRTLGAGAQSGVVEAAPRESPAGAGGSSLSTASNSLMRAA